VDYCLAAAIGIRDLTWLDLASAIGIRDLTWPDLPCL
jgi:hypothetical protein